MIRKSRYVIAVPDLAISVAYYRDVLGFRTVVLGDTGWAFYELDECFIMAGECKDALSPSETGDHSYFAYLEVDDADAWAKRLQAAGADFIAALRTESWGMREFGIRTVDGHRIRFGQEVEQVGE